MLPVLQALANGANARADHRQALTYAQQLLALAERLNHPVYQAIGQRMVGISHFFFGDYPTARIHLEQSIALYPSPENGVNLPIPAGREEAIFSRMWLPQILLLLGYPEQAVAYSRQTLAQAQVMNRAYPRFITLLVAGTIFYTVGKCPQKTVAHAEQALAILEDNASSGYHGWATFYRGWGVAMQGEPETGLSLMNAGLSQLQQAGTQASMVHLYTLLAEVSSQLKQFDRGLEFLAKALKLSEQTGARSFLAEIYRGQGELMMKRGAESEAESLFEQAINVARQQQLRLWELRATVSLARLQQKQGCITEAQSSLTTIYGWFTEGFDMPDLREARALLEELGDGSFFS
jgi:tetratricopeptide (TPR) repeat protein